MADEPGPWVDWDEKVAWEVEHDIIKLEKMLAEEGKHRVLAVGCGAGRHLLYLAQRGFEVHGFDVSESAIHALEETVDGGEYGADVRVADFSEEFPCEDESFDAAVATRSSNHTDVATINHAMDEISRVLSPSGLVYVQVPTYEKLIKLQESGKAFERVEPGTNIPEDGQEAGVPHHNFRREDVLDVFSAFDPEAFKKRRDHHCLRARRP